MIQKLLNQLKKKNKEEIILSFFSPNCWIIIKNILKYANIFYKAKRCYENIINGHPIFQDYKKAHNFYLNTTNYTTDETFKIVDEYLKKINF